MFNARATRVLGLFCFALLISCVVSTRQLTQTTEESKELDGYGEVGYGYGHGSYGGYGHGGYGGYGHGGYGHGGYGGHYPPQEEDKPHVMISTPDHQAHGRIPRGGYGGFSSRGGFKHGGDGGQYPPEEETKN